MQPKYNNIIKENFFYLEENDVGFLQVTAVDFKT